MRALVFLGAMLAGTAAWPCDVLLSPEPADVGSTSQAATTAPSGGVWWIAAPFSPADEIALERAGGERLVVDESGVVHRGPFTLGLRVPDEARAGDAYLLAHPTEPSLHILLEVSEGQSPTVSGAPRIGSITAQSLSETLVQACTLGFAEREERSVTLVEITPELDEGRSAEELRLDVWLVAPGEDAPSDTAPRPLDAFRAVDTNAGTDADTIRLRVARDGEHDVLVRLIDPLTGARSAIERARIRNAPDRFAGWDLLGGWHWGCAQTSASDGALLALLLLGLVGRRRRRPCAA